MSSVKGETWMHAVGEEGRKGGDEKRISNDACLPDYIPRVRILLSLTESSSMREQNGDKPR
jgi:hypothetical protein